MTDDLLVMMTFIVVWLIGLTILILVIFARLSEFNL